MSYLVTDLHEMTHSVSSLAIDGPTGAIIESTVATSQESIDSKLLSMTIVISTCIRNVVVEMLSVACDISTI